MDKAQAKIIMAAHGVPVADGRTVSRFEAASEHVLPRPYVLKPVAEGSSVGVFIVREDMDHPPQELTRDDWTHGDLLLAEPYIPGLELTCAVMGDTPLGVIEIQSELSFYDYEAKYAPGGSRHILPAKILPNIYQKVRMLSLTAHRALGCRGISRSDFRYDDRTGDESGLVCLEVNTQPGMTETSLVPELAAHAGHSFGELVRWMVEDASLDR
jgi:D-alanine-D-alanine ligase